MKITSIKYRDFKLSLFNLKKSKIPLFNITGRIDSTVCCIQKPLSGYVIDNVSLNKKRIVFLTKIII